MKKLRFALDTDFLIKLVNPDQDLHANAVLYFNRMIELEIEMYLPAIVIAEFSIQQSISDINGAYIPIPFTPKDGVTAAEIAKIKIAENNSLGDPEIDRVRMKDDIKICAQVLNNGLDGLITAERKLYSKLYSLVVNHFKRPIACHSIHDSVNKIFPLKDNGKNENESQIQIDH